MKRKLQLFTILVGSLGIVGASSVKGSIQADYNGGAQSGETFYDADILTTDLINGGQASLASEVTGANDGAASSGDLSHDLFLTDPSGNTLTFNLNLDPLTGGRQPDIPSPRFKPSRAGPEPVSPLNGLN